jgi:glycosyltransferase involved in cell wall biosynthesis
MYDPRFTWVWAPFIQFIDTRIIVGEIFKQKFGQCYREAGIPEKYLDRLKIVFYRLEFLPDTFHQRNFELPLKIYYAGRGGPQKRVWIIVNIIQKCQALNLPVEFKLAGSFKNELPNEILNDGCYVGELKGGDEMYNLHKQNDILLMTSAWEGFPLVIMEAMAFGAIPLVTNIDAIPEHIVHGENGYLLNQVMNESELVNEAIHQIQDMIANRKQLSIVSLNAYNYAISNFSAEKFRKGYRSVVLSD